MATRRQKIAAKVVVNSGTPTEAMRVAQYAPSVIRNPKVLTEAKGFKEALAEYGLTEEFVVGALVEDIEAKPGKRYHELNLGSEILGIKKREEGGNTNINVIFAWQSPS